MDEQNQMLDNGHEWPLLQHDTRLHDQLNYAISSLGVDRAINLGAVCCYSCSRCVSYLLDGN